jgi:polysaccharide export outer membrane protein
MNRARKLVQVAALLWCAVAAPAGAKEQSILGPRDILQINVYQQQDLTQEVRVGDDGMLNLPLVGPVKASGLTVEQLTKELTVRYRDYIFKPEITIFVKEYHKREIEVSVLGEVARPGLYKYPEGSSLLEVLSQVGGLTKESGERVVVFRPGRGGKNAADAILVNAEELFSPAGMKSQNISLQDGDTVNVPRADQYFVFGEVNHPGSYKLEKGTVVTVLKAISLAGGFTDKASRKSIRITREEGDAKTELKADLDTPIRAQDIIIVPESFF